MTTRILKLLLVSTLLSSSVLVHAATLTSSVNRNPIKINEPLTLTITYTNTAPSTDLDLSELSRDFEILANSPSTNSSVRIINGNTSRETATTWTITLAAKREGELTIPAFEIDGERSEPILLRVNALTAEELSQPQPIEVNVTIDDTDNLSIRPGEQIIVEVELSAATNVSNIRGQELAVEGAELVLLGQQDGQRQENGVIRQVAIWRYALFPENPGEILLPAQTFSGSIGGRSSFFDSFTRGGQPVSARSVEQSIVVDDRNNTNANAWFPANDVTVTSSWAGNTNQIKVGEPITRTITITATGQRASAIPPLTKTTSANYKSYQDQPQLEDSNYNQGVIGVRIESEAIVPSTEGVLTLPEQRISWWDNKSDVWREAILPAESLTVLAGNLSVSPAANTPQTNSALPPTVTNSETADAFSQSSSLGQNWIWKFTTLILAGIVALQVIFIRKQPNSRLSETNAHRAGTQIKESEAWQTLEQDFTRNEPTKIRSSILRWAQKALNDEKINTLDSLTKLGGSEALKDQLDLLDQQLYAGGSGFEPEKCKSALTKLRQDLRKQKGIKDTDDVLQPLYPS